MERKDYRRAIEDFSKVIELKPDYSNAFESRAYAKSLNRKYKDALVDFDKAISMNPGFHEAYHHRAWTHAALRDTVVAIADFNKAIELNEEIAIYHDDLGLILMKSGNFKDAMKAFSKAVKLDENLGSRISTSR